MKLINEIKFTQDSIDFNRYLFIGIFLIIIFHRLNHIFNYRNIVVIILTLLIIFIIFKFNSQNLLNQFVKYKDKVKLINDDSLTYLLKDMKILSLYANIIEVRKFNSITFNNSMRDMNLFLKGYDDIKNSNQISIYLYEHAIYRRNMAINYLLSLILGIPAHAVTLNQDKYYSANLSYTLLIQKAVKELRKITSEYLLEMSKKLNNEWENSETYWFSKPIYTDIPNPNPDKDPLYNKHLNIY